MKLSPKQLHIIQHSLGCDEYGRSKSKIPSDEPYYRNRFITGQESDDWDCCIGLVAAGMLHDHGPQSIAGGMHCFTVTDEGIQTMREESPTPPKISRSRQRYLRYLEYGDMFQSFRDFLRWDSDKERSWN